MAGAAGGGMAGAAGAAGGGMAGGAGGPGGSTGGATGAGGTSPWPNCRPIFDGKTFDGWGGTQGWKITADGAMASTGVGAQSYTTKSYKALRWIFSVQHKSGNHNPCTIVWGRNTNRGLSGIQIQAPTCGGWDYRPGQNKALPVQCPKAPPIDLTKWAQCEILAKADGTLRMACCQQDASGNTPCKATENLIYSDPTAPNLGPIGYMIHNDGIYDQYKNICAEENPTDDTLITTH